MEPIERAQLSGVAGAAMTAAMLDERVAEAYKAAFFAPQGELVISLKRELAARNLKIVEMKDGE